MTFISITYILKGKKYEMTLKNTEPFIMFISTCILWLFTFVELSLVSCPYFD